MNPASVIGALILCACSAVPARADETADAALEAAVDAPARSPKFLARDAYRHPKQELAFFGVTPRATVVEIWPAGGYWTEMLAPLLRDHGTYYAAIEGPPSDPSQAEAAAKRNALFRAKLAADPATYDRVVVTTLGGRESAIAPPGSADLVLAFRDLHVWMKSGETDAVLAAILRALKPGGVLGIEDHRGQRSGPQDPRARDGYVDQAYAIALVEKAGFAFVGASEIDANPKDTANWPRGVWTLPPTYALGGTDRATYAAIGEADNFVLKFRKPGP